MRTIGMLGGMSWESTALYQRLANELVRERPGGLSSADLVVLCTNYRHKVAPTLEAALVLP